MREQLQENTKNNTLHYNTAPDKPNYTNTERMPTTNTQTPAATQASPAQPPEPDPEVLLLMDSNGKFLNPQKLFPHQKITAKRCSTQATPTRSSGTLQDTPHVLSSTLGLMTVTRCATALLMP